MADLALVEKALTHKDFAGQVQSLKSIHETLRRMGAKSLPELELDVRGRLITSLSRVSRQSRPAEAAESAEAAAPSEEAPAATEPASESTEASAEVPAEAAQEVPPESAEPAEAPAEAGEAASEQTSVEAAPEGEGEGAAEPPAKAEASTAEPPAPKPLGYADVLYWVGAIWRALSETDRAESAFALAGRGPGPELDVAVRSERPARPEGAREGAGRNRERAGGKGREPREGKSRNRREPAPLPPPGADWKEQAAFFEEHHRTRDAARLHERYGSYAEATRLFETGGDLRAATRSALLGKDMDSARRLLAGMPPAQAEAVMEKAEAFELLMEHHVTHENFEQVAKLYERARQFDQAALAWERAGKLGPARKAFERAHDVKGADRIRALEVTRLTERGDRLGAAQLLLQSGKRLEAAESLSSLPPAKAFRFLQKLGLDEEAGAIARAELASAEEKNQPLVKATWLELTGDLTGALALLEQEGRKDRASVVCEKMGEIPRAAQLAEEAGLKRRSLELYRKLGDAAGVERALAMPELPPKPARGAEGEAEAEPSGEEEPSPAEAAPVVEAAEAPPNESSVPPSQP